MTTVQKEITIDFSDAASDEKGRYDDLGNRVILFRSHPDVSNVLDSRERL